MSTDPKTLSIFQITGDLLLEFMKETGKSVDETSKKLISIWEFSFEQFINIRFLFSTVFLRDTIDSIQSSGTVKGLISPIAMSQNQQHQI